MVHEKNSIMNDIFSGRIKVNKQEHILMEQGYGTGIGGIGGSYESYIKQLRGKTNIKNGVIYLGKNIDTSTDTPSIIDPTIEFKIGDIPKVLLVFHSLIDQLAVRATWKEKDSEYVILESYYVIPSPYSMKHDWWNLYSVYFIAPENLGEGEYQILLDTTDIKRNRLTSITGFSIRG